MNSISLVQTSDRLVNQLQQNIKQAVDPLLKNPVLTGTLNQSVSLSAGSNTINHNLGTTLQGWFLTRIRANATVYDAQDTNPSPQTTLILIASAPVVVDVYCF